MDYRSNDADPGVFAQIVGLLLALFLLAGRWSVSRILGTEDALLQQPRLWLVMLLGVVALAPIRAVKQGPHLLPILAFLAYMIASALWSPDSELATAKVLELLMLGAALVVIWRFSRAFGARTLAVTTTQWILVLCVAFAALAVTASPAGGRLAVLGGGPNVFGRNMALLTIGFAALGLKRKQIAWFAPAVVPGLLVILSGSRGAMLAAAAGAAVLVSSSRVKVARLAYLAVVGTVGTALFLTYTDMGQTAIGIFQHRFLHLLVEQQYYSGRSEVYADALALGRQFPIFGAGLAGFRGYDLGVYPHNVFLEAFAEGGLIALALLVWALAPATRPIVARDPTVPPLHVAMWVVFLGSAQFSGDFYDSRGVFAYMLLIAGQMARPDSLADNSARKLRTSAPESTSIPPPPRPTLRV